MKRPNIILLFLMILACCASRHKEKEFDKTDPVVSEVTPTVSTYQATFAHGQSCTVHANLANGYSFQKWTVDGNNQNVTLSGSGNTRTFTMPDSPVEVSAPFQAIEYTIQVSASPTNGGSVYVGNVPGTTHQNFNYGDPCTVHATPNNANGFIFENWTENDSVVSTYAEYQFTVMGNRTLVAHFTALPPDTYSINVSANPSNGGTVTGGGSFPADTTITIRATPNSGYQFIKWMTGDGIEIQEPEHSFTVTQDSTFVAYFALNQNSYTLSINYKYTDGTQAAPTYTDNVNYGAPYSVASPTITGYTPDIAIVSGTMPAHDVTVDVTYGINSYTLTINYKYADGTQAAPTHTEDVNYGASYNVTSPSITGYTPDIATVSGTMPDHDVTVDVTYNINTYTISVSASPSNGGTVAGCGTYQQGQQCTVIATASDCFSFSNWTENGNPVSYDANYTFTVNSNRTLVANFTPLPPNTYNINVSPNPSDGGMVTGGGTYTHGQQCTVKATANPGYTFKKWTENGNLVSTEANYRFNVTGSRTLVAQFQQQNYTITASADPVNGGTVTGDGTYAYGVTCILTATPNEGYTFEHWKKGNTIVSTEFVHSFEVTENASFTANFKPIHQYSITATAEPEEGGTVTGYGTYAYGITCILTATPNEGYTFEHWKKGNTIFSTELVHSFEVTENASFIANFKPILVPHYTISVSANPTDWGEVYIGDSIGTTESTFAQGKYCTVHAEANDGYTFINWTENDSVVSNDKDFQFKVTSNRKLIANFKEIPCIELKDIEAKKHKTQYNDMVVLILVYPEAGYKYQWLRSDEENGDYTEIPGVTGQYYYKKGGIEEGYYKVRITKGECELVTEKPYKVQYPLKQLRIYPNPSRRDHNIVVVNDSDSPSQLSIYSTDGRLLHTQTVTDSQTTLNLNLPSGVYIAYLTDSEGCTKVGKLIIQ